MCDERERLIGFVYDECDPEERRLIAQHLEECSECREDIGALRGVRQDLLAWEVEGEPAVWRPFVAPVAVPWYRQVPGWALAAAASLTLAIGAAGGVVTHAWLAPAPATVAVAPPPAVPDLRDVEQRVLARMRSELAAVTASAEPAAVRVVDRAPGPNINQLLTDSERRLQQVMLDFYKEWANSTRSRDQEMRELKNKVAFFEEFIAMQGGR